MVVCALDILLERIQHVHAAAFCCCLAKYFPEGSEGFSIQEPTPTDEVGVVNASDGRGSWVGQFLVHDGCGMPLLLVLFPEHCGN